MLESQSFEYPADVWVELTADCGEKEEVWIKLPAHTLKLSPLVTTAAAALSQAARGRGRERGRFWANRGGGNVIAKAATLCKDKKEYSNNAFHSDPSMWYFWPRVGITIVHVSLSDVLELQTCAYL